MRRNGSLTEKFSSRLARSPRRKTRSCRTAAASRWRSSRATREPRSAPPITTSRWRAVAVCATSAPWPRSRGSTWPW